jgi:drug/metabolite transporter (DMT)-like permease
VLAWSLPFGFAVLWASSYAAAKIGLADITPFAFVALRLALAAIGAALILLMRRTHATRSRKAGRISSWAARWCTASPWHPRTRCCYRSAPRRPRWCMPSIQSSPRCSPCSLLGETFRWWQWAGVALGFCGVLIGVPVSAGGNALLLLGFSLVGLSGGTLYLKRFCAEVPPFEATMVQLVGGALLAGLATLALETPHAHWTGSLIGAMAWNTVLMSVGGMALYNFILIQYGAGRAASCFFVVPGAAALIAWTVLDETLSRLTVLGLAAATVGVALVWWRPERA